MLVETDTAKRNQLIKQAYEISNKDWAYIPLHQQALAWGVSKKVNLPQRADNPRHVPLGDQAGIATVEHEVPAASGFRDLSFSG